MSCTDDLTPPEVLSTSPPQSDPASPLPSVSVVVLSKDEPQLATSLELLVAQATHIAAEIVVVDASDHRLDDIRRAFPTVVWIDYLGPFWRSSTIPHQRNVGVRASSGDVIAFCDAGGEPTPNWLETITAPLLDATHALVCGPIRSLHPSVFTLINDAPDGAVVESPPTANVAFTKAHFNTLGGFDERFHYGSDVDFAWRSSQAGHPCISVASAEMGMDWGPAATSVRRAWRYGRAWARLYRRHDSPDRHRQMVRSSPERVIYPTWLLGLAATIGLAAAVRKLRWLPVAWISLLAIPTVKNRSEADLSGVLVDHLVGATAVLAEAAITRLKLAGPVVFVPNDPSPYIAALRAGLEATGTRVDAPPRPTRSQSLNVLLAPFGLIRQRLAGTRIIHIHWTFGFTSPLFQALPGGPRLARLWLALYLAVADRLGLKVVYTAHNIEPHHPVFDDDRAARQTLLDHSSALIALSAASAEVLVRACPTADPKVIPQGPYALPVPTRARAAIRDGLGLSDQPCFTLFGQLHWYKGAHILLEAAAMRPGLSVRIAGAASGDYAHKLQTLASSAAAAAGAAGSPFGVGLNLEWLSDSELAELILASDFCVLPATEITNSSSVYLALTAGRPVIIPALAALADIPESVAIRYNPVGGPAALAGALDRAIALSLAAYQSMSDSARTFAADTSWATAAALHLEAYRSAMEA